MEHSTLSLHQAAVNRRLLLTKKVEPERERLARVPPFGSHLLRLLIMPTAPTAEDLRNLRSIYGSLTDAEKKERFVVDLPFGGGVLVVWGS